MTDLIRQLPPFISLRLSGRALCGLFLALAVVGWFAVGFDVAKLLQLGKLAAGTEISDQERESYYLVGVIVTGVQAGLALFAVFGFVAWLFRARVNVRALGLRRFAYAREWTVLGFLIPGLNLVRPYQVVSEVWRASDPSTLDSFDWKLVETPNRVRVWWATVLVYAALLGFTLAMGMTAAPTAHQLQLARGMRLLADAAGAVSAALTVLVVGGISQNQEAKAAQLLEPAPAGEEA